MGEKRNRPTYRVLVEMSQKGYHSNDPGLGGRIILKWIIKKLFIVNIK